MRVYSTPRHFHAEHETTRIVRGCYTRNSYELSAKACDKICYAPSIDAYK